MTPSVWQVSGGAAERPCGAVFLRHGVALVSSAWAIEGDSRVEVPAMDSALLACHLHGAEERRLLDAMLLAVPRCT